MTDNVNALRFGDITKNLKGHAKLELFDARSGELVQKVEQDNMVTNAVSYLAPILAGAKEIQSPYYTKIYKPLLDRYNSIKGVIEQYIDNFKRPLELNSRGLSILTDWINYY